MAGTEEDMSLEITYMVSHVVAPPSKSVVLHFGMENGEPFASTLPCVGVAIMAGRCKTCFRLREPERAEKTQCVACAKVQSVKATASRERRTP